MCARQPAVLAPAIPDVTAAEPLPVAATPMLPAFMASVNHAFRAICVLDVAMLFPKCRCLRKPGAASANVRNEMEAAGIEVAQRPPRPRTPGTLAAGA